MNQQSPILKTLAFFQIYNHPLTLLELWERLLAKEKISWEDFTQQLNELLVKGAVVATQGFFFLPAMTGSIEQRIRRVFWENEKMRIAQRAAGILRPVPFIKLIAVCNTLSFGVSNPESDIDFFIVAKAGRLWLVRAWSVFLLFIFGLYRRGQNVRNQICLSFFIDDKSLNLQKLALAENFDGPDVYLIYWITQLIPLINREKTLEKFWQVNSWIKRVLVNWNFQNQEDDYRMIGGRGLFDHKILELILGGWVGNRLEKIFKKMQLLKMKSNKDSRRFEESSAVVVSDEILKFHEADRRELYRKMWQENLQKMP